MYYSIMIERNKSTLTHVDNHNERCNNRIKELEALIRKQAQQIEELEKKPELNVIMDNFIDTWFENNKDCTNLGQIKLFDIMGWSKTVDVMPDELEKHIYKKMMRIIISFIKSL